MEKLYRLKLWYGHGHTAIEDVSRGFAKSDRGYVNDALEALRRRGFVIHKPTHYGTQVWLNPSRRADIEKLLGLDEKK